MMSRKVWGIAVDVDAKLAEKLAKRTKKEVPPRGLFVLCLLVSLMTYHGAVAALSFRYSPVLYGFGYPCENLPISPQSWRMGRQGTPLAASSFMRGLSKFTQTMQIPSILRSSQRAGYSSRVSAAESLINVIS